MKGNPNIAVGALVVVLGVTLGVILLRPSARDLRRAKALDELARFSVATDEAAWKRVDQCAGFQQVSGKRNGEMIVFMPKKGVDVAQLADSFRNSVSDANVKIVPLPDKNSPTSEKLLKLCLVHRWSSLSSIQQGIANGPQSNKARVDKMWAEVPKETRDRIDAQLAENKRVYEELHKFGGYFRYGDIYRSSDDIVGVVKCSQMTSNF